MAEDARPAAADLDEVVVTAERTSRTLRDTSSSVVVTTADELEGLAGAYTLSDVVSLVPNVVITRTGGAGPAVRGLDGTGPAVGANAFFAGTRPRVNFQVDGRTLTFNETIYVDGVLSDIQQVEVYRGPQSTLQGRNAVGGVIAVKTADPTFDWQGRARLVAGGGQTRQATAAIGGPIIAGQLAFRLAGDYRREESYVRFTPYVGVSNPDLYESKVLRGKLLITPTALPQLDALITLSHTEALAPQTHSVTRPFDEHAAAFPRQPRFRTRADVAIGDLKWRFSDMVSGQLFLIGADFRVNRYADPGDGIAQIDGKEYTAEPRLRFGSSDDVLSGFLAAYVFHSHQHESIDLFGGGLFDDSTRTRAVFGETAWKPAERVTVTLGARYEEEDRHRVGGSGPFNIAFDHTYKAFLPRATVSLRASDAVTVGATVGKGYNAGGAGFAFNPPFPSYEYGKETVWNYEAFVRGALLDRRLEVSANAFFNDYNGLQLPFDVAQDPTAPALVIRNAERATTYGAELQARFRASEGLELFANAGLLKTEVNRYNDPLVEGNELPRAPAFSASAGLRATPWRGLDVGFDVRYSDAYYSDVFNAARGKTDPYAIANAQVGYRFGPMRAFVAVTNLFDATGVQEITTGTTRALDVASISQPRRATFGIEAAF
jgi:outer membrane receptor protein involved in Fe transport